MLDKSYWIAPQTDMGDIVPEFVKTFEIHKKVSRAQLTITAMGVYTARLNGQRIGDFILAPGWTNYEKRLQVQRYDVTEMLEKKNTLTVLVGKGWCRGVMPSRDYNVWSDCSAIIGELTVEYTDGSSESFITDKSWLVNKSAVIYSDIYNGEYYDARGIEYPPQNVCVKDLPRHILIEQEGVYIKEHGRIKPVRYIITPRGEHVLDFGKNMTGYVEFELDTGYGEKVAISHAETLDKYGNFYTANLRTARARVEYISKKGRQTYKPNFTFMGFRYIRLDDYPGKINPDKFTAIEVYSDIKRTGHFSCSNELVNRLYGNVIQSQKSNYLDVPTDCPQRDERLGWTGDAQVFVKTASYNFDVERFFTKWLADLASEQYDFGGVPNIIPNAMRKTIPPDDKHWCQCAAWGDACVICPWQIYLTYGNKEILKRQIQSMKKWVEGVRRSGDNEYLWNSGRMLGDWLATDAADGSWNGGSDQYFIASAFYANSVNLLAKSMRAIGENPEEYEELYRNIVREFKKTYSEPKTQTECALALVYGLTDDKEGTVKKLAGLIEKNGGKIATGFVGTPYILYALSDNGYEEAAYSLLLSEEFPSWLFSVRMGATTIWEHWDGINENGDMWGTEMNSFNHYAYGAVASWMYEVMAGINTDEAAPGFGRAVIKPKVTDRLDFAEASIETRHGTIKSRWDRNGDEVVYSITSPVEFDFIAADCKKTLPKGEYRLIQNGSSIEIR